MAKAKKGKLTIEDALVPVEEQPYEIPENWCWTLLSSVADWGSGGTPSRKNPEYYEGDIPWIKTGELEDGYIFDSEEKITEDAIAHSSAKLFPIDSVLIAMYGATIGKTAILGIPATTNQACASARCNDALSNKYLFYYLRSQKDSFIAKGKGGAQPNISQDIIKGHPIPLPPLAEQQRIVEQIENLFSKLDEAKEKAESAIESFSKRRDAVLYNAFQGKLTENWRKEKLCRLDDWNNVIIKDVCIDIKVGIVIKPTQYYVEKESGIPAFRSANVRDSYIEDSDWVFINEKGQRENQRSEVHTGDVLIVRSGNPGTACVVTEKYDGYNAIDIIIAVPNQEKVLPQYLCYYTNSPECKGMVDSNKRGMALQHFNVGGYSKLPISVPSLDEQRMIVQIIEKELEEESKAKEKIQLVIEQIDTIKKSILAKAFRGELGTNIADEESSIELLKSIIEA